MNKNNQDNLPFLHKDTNNIITKGKIILKLEKNKFLITYNNKRYICLLNDQNKIYACYNLWN
ncbi:MAG TPA: hypothetical protein EYQ51_07285 [Alphaproteobacteria bacterium]|jgi:maltooligosyltrehalose synthase|nr:hypothetical protein [Alphaproteobacteria bacterium]HIK87807.1 hypothetical protein [Alphaproteobacteria bacterium]